MSENKDPYKDTVFLPKTDFPMRGGLPQKEPEILKQWDDQDIEGQLRAKGKTESREKWILHDGPPYANGNIHMGHAVNKILKDVVVRSYQMKGYDSPYVPGWDCHGLPIEWKIEEQYREKGLDKDKVDPLQFRKECREFAQKWVDIQSEQFQRLGVGGNWDTPYLTMNLKSEGQIVREIHEFVKKDLLYRGAKPVMWSVVEKTALAEAEVEYKEHKSVTIWVRFPVIKTGLDLIKDADLVIWTTTPWTIPSNRAMAYGRDMEYGVYEVKSVSEGASATPGDKIALAIALADSVKVQAKIEDWTCTGTFKGADLDGTICQHPLAALDEGYGAFDVPLLEGDFVTDDAGTGFVHIAPGHGEDDFFLYMKNFGASGIPDNVGDDGTFNDHVPLFAGLAVYTQDGKLGDGNFAVLKALSEAGKLLSKGSLRHEYPHSWRSKAPLIFRNTPQWFIAMDIVDGRNVEKEAIAIDLKDPPQEMKQSLRRIALNQIRSTHWVPAKGEARITSMIQNRPDWCISRQRAWGVPIALFVHKDTKEILKDDAVFERIATIFEEEGSDAWWNRDAQDFLGDQRNADDYEQVFDIVDVWFESGSTHAFVCEEREELQSPADLYLEGSDQHRGWFHSSLLESCGTRGRAPYKAVLTHGFVLDDKGYKMSKSLGNVVDPLKIMDQYGADILRLWTLTSDYSEDIRIGKDTLKNTGDLYRRIRNTLRFLLGALEGFTKDEFIEDFFEDPSNIPELEQLILHQLYEMDKKVQSCIENYDFQKLTKELHDFCNENLSAFYFDIRKDRLYCDEPDSYKRRVTRSVMAIIFNGLTAWLAPILCFTAEEAWSHRPDGVFEDKQSVHLRDFPSVPDCWHNPALAGKWMAVRSIRKKVLEAIEPMRASKELGSSLEAEPHLILGRDDAKALDGLDLAEICISAPAEIQTDESIQNGAPSITIEKTDGHKCERCWKILPEVQNNGSLCNRCVQAVDHIKKAA